jgi:large subunit ribosomal protein L6
LLKTLDIVGVGYKAELKGEGILFTIGYSHHIYFFPRKELIGSCTPTQIKVPAQIKSWLVWLLPK